MATTDELLASLSESTPEHTHNVSDSDTYFIINPITRQVVNTASTKNVLMQFDHDSERFTFELPRYVENHDMTLCNVVKVHYNNLDSETDVENTGVYDVTDLAVDPENPNNVICSWLISRNATQLIGPLSFIVQYACVIDGELVYEWHSDIYYDIEIKAGRNNGDAAVGQYIDVFEQWRDQLFGAADSAMTDIENSLESSLFTLNAAKDAHKDEISAKAEEVLATIPEDYTTTHEMADEALRKKANAIILSESGETPIFLDDTSDSYLLGLNLYGKTTQITTTGKNLMNCDENFSFTQSAGLDVSIPAGTYIMSFEGTVTSGPNGLCVRYYDNDVWIILDNNKKSETVVLNKPETKIYTYSNGTTNNDGVGITASVKRLMLSIDGGMYEPHSGGVASPSPDWPQPLKTIENPTVEMYGKNLLIDSKMIKSHSAGGITCNYEGNGIFHIHGTYTHIANSIQLSTCDLNIPVDPNRKYTLHGKLLEGSIPGTYHPYVGIGSETVATMNWMSLFMNNEKISIGETIIYSGVPKATLADATHITRFWIYHYNPDMTSYTADFRIQVWLTADDGSEFQPSDEKQSIEIPRTLNGIPVHQNGNYTDSSGLQWTCDEIDFERGKFIQRCGYYVFDGSEDEDWLGIHAHEDKRYVSIEIPPGNDVYTTRTICNYSQNGAWGKDVVCFIDDSKRFTVGGPQIIGEQDTVATFREKIAASPIELTYVLGTPIEHDLTSTELQTFRALTTNATNTTIFNNQNARMSVKYVADLERYIHKNVTVKEVAFDLILLEANWVPSSDERYYTQVIDYTPRSNGRISLNPSAAQQVSLILDGIAMFIANENGVATAYCISSTPGRDITIPASEQVVVFE